MRYFYTKPEFFIRQHYGVTYRCNHKFYNECTLYLVEDKGIAVIQERFEPKLKARYFGPIDPWLADDIYKSEGFRDFFLKNAKPKDEDGLYPTIPVRRIMWALRIKPLKKEWWETNEFYRYP